MKLYISLCSVACTYYYSIKRFINLIWTVWCPILQTGNFLCLFLINGKLSNLVIVSLLDFIIDLHLHLCLCLNTINSSFSNLVPLVEKHIKSSTFKIGFFEGVSKWLNVCGIEASWFAVNLIQIVIPRLLHLYIKTFMRWLSIIKFIDSIIKILLPLLILYTLPCPMQLILKLLLLVAPINNLAYLFQLISQGQLLIRELNLVLIALDEGLTYTLPQTPIDHFLALSHNPYELPLLNLLILVRLTAHTCLSRYFTENWLAARAFKRIYTLGFCLICRRESWLSFFK